jgi:hypothetical protein
MAKVNNISTNRTKTFMNDTQNGTAIQRVMEYENS